MVEGCRQLETRHELYFLTITSPGGDMSPEEATEKWLDWTNRFLDALRMNGKRRGIYWSYCGVTEWQKRGHPHSHYLMTYFPEDLEDGLKPTTIQLANGGEVSGCVDALRSTWLQRRCISSGLGEQYDVSQVVTVEGVSRYVAKYLFKQTMFSASYPERWHRVRYSQSFPKLPVRNRSGMALLTPQDWRLLAQKAVVVCCSDDVVAREARYQLRGADVILQAHRPKQPAI